MKTTTLTTAQQIVFVLVYALVIGIIRLLTRGIDWTVALDSAVLVVGILIGSQIYIADLLIYAYITNPESNFAQKIKSFVQHKQWNGLVHFLNSSREEQLKLATFNVLFLVVWIVLTLFVMTSSPSFFAKGLVMGIGLILSYKLFQHRTNWTELGHQLFWPVSKPLGKTELKTLVYLFWIMFGVFTLFGF